MVCIPWIMGPALYLIKAILGPEKADLALKFVVGWSTMANWKGRQEKNALFLTQGKR